MIAAGGIGLAPLRSVMYHVISQREKYGKAVLLYGARTPADILYRRNSSSGVRTLILMYTSPLIAQQAPGEEALELSRSLFLERHLIRGIQLRWSVVLKS